MSDKEKFMKDLDLTKPIRLKVQPGIACVYLGSPFGLHIVAFEDGDLGGYEDMNRIFENAPEAPWVPDDSGDWIEGGVEMLPENVATFELLQAEERETTAYAKHAMGAHEIPRVRGWTEPPVAVKPLTLKYVKP